MKALKLGRKRFFSLLAVSALLLSAVGCSQNTASVKKYNENADYYSVEKEIAAENEFYRIMWNDQTGEIKFENRKSGDIWTTRSLEGETYDTDPDAPVNPQLKSPILIKYYDGTSNQENVAIGYTHSLQDENFSAVETENGIEVTYYFPKIEISVPVNYSVTENGFRVSVNPKNITENDKKIFSLAIMPFMCSVNNKLSADDAYLFVPSGSGTLIYPKEIGDGVTSLISEQVYGTDKQNGENSVTNKVGIKMPVFGAKIKNSAMCAVIDKGAENAEIVTNVGSSTYGFSTVYAQFNLRGGFYCESTYMQWYESKQNLYSDSIIENEVSVTFSPLNEEKANYMGFAEVYRNYLKTEKGLKETSDDSILNLKIVGGIETKDFLFGIPFTKLFVTTTFSDASDIITELSEKTGIKLNAELIGFGNSGYNIGTVAGGLKYNGKFGNPKKLTGKTDGNTLFFDFDILRFSSSGCGISKMSGSALAALNQKNYIYEKDIVTASESTSGQKYLYVKRSALNDLSQKAVSKAKKWGFNGVGFETLSNQAYSDYRDNKYNAKSGTANQAYGIISKAHGKSMKVSVSAANDYAAVGADIIYDTPYQSDEYQVYDENIPFYQIVFKGYIPMSSVPLNLSQNSHTQMLYSARTGTGLSYTVIKNYSTSLLHSENNLFYNSLYDDIKDTVVKDISEYKNCFDGLSGQKITNYIIHNRGITETVFENDARVFVNTTEKPADVGGTVINAESYLYRGGDNK